MRRALLCIIALLVVATPVVPLSSAAADEVGLDQIKTAAHAAIATRLLALHRTVALVQRSPFMGDDAPARVAAMRATATGLVALDAEIQGDTDVVEARADAARIATDFRVYVLVLPVTHLTRGADAVTAVAVPTFERLATRLQAAIDEKGATDLQPLLDDLQAHVAAAAAASSPLPDELAMLTPADWNANDRVLLPAQRALRGASGDLQAARQLAREIVAGLRS
jgi:hypothetical protein